MGDYEKNTSYQVIREGSYECLMPNGEKETQNYKKDIIQTSDGTIFGIEYRDLDKNKNDYERISIQTYSQKDGKLLPNNDKQTLSKVSDLTKEYLVFGQQRTIVLNEPYVLLKDKDGYDTEINNNKALVHYLNDNLASPENNTNISPAKEGFISGENNSKYIVPKNDGAEILVKTNKPLLFRPEKTNLNKVEEMPQNLEMPKGISYFEIKDN